MKKSRSNGISKAHPKFHNLSYFSLSSTFYNALIAKRHFSNVRNSKSDNDEEPNGASILPIIFICTLYGIVMKETVVIDDCCIIMEECNSES
ncbi:Uncharacterized protein BM_BM860 [Brugia malayi]|uniref:Bm14212 n=1 Tax=Brugia malayi TaxID=6279 RepID=A0A1P6CEP5_BRUMA|nr:Uncharacterized protein BM_BM860 [Brugia malayi]CDP96357.1 Bm14212 [Brugia malayi]VIO98375.1 Uncharacterized protein BM_BM860 [Brugia malayi]